MGLWEAKTDESGTSSEAEGKWLLVSPFWHQHQAIQRCIDIGRASISNVGCQVAGALGSVLGTQHVFLLILVGID